MSEQHTDLLTETLSDEEFKAELDLRHEELMRDQSVGVPWEEVKQMTKID